MIEQNPMALSAQETCDWMTMLSVSQEGQMLPEPYYRQFGLRRAVQLVAPTLRPIDRMQMPRESMLHHLPLDEALYGIEPDDPLIALERRMVPVEHVMKLTGNAGPPRPMPVQPMRLVRDYHRKYRRMRRIMNMASVLKDPVTPIVVNYGLLPHLYRYTRTYLASYNKWLNIQTTQLDTVKHYLKVTKRAQYIPCYLPTRLPSVQLLNRASMKLTRSLLNVFNEPSALVILELWKWLGENRQDSMFDKFTLKELDRINLFFIESGQWFVVNMGLLNSWRKTEDNPQGVIIPPQMQRRFLRLLMFLFEERTVGSDDMPVASDTPVEKTPEPTESSEPTAPPKDAAPQTTPPKDPEIDSPVETVRQKPARIKVETPEGNRTIVLKEGMNIDILPEDDQVEETEVNIDVIDRAITKDLDALEEIFANMDEEEEEEYPEIEEAEKPRASEADQRIVYTPQERTLENGIMNPAQQLAEQGLLSAPELRRMRALSEAYKRLPDPYGRTESLEQIAKVDYSELKIESQLKVPDSSTVMDKSMLNNTLTEFTERYIEDILPKDITRSVLAVQHAGVAVTGYKVEEVEDATGAHEEHTVQFTPVRGKPSTLTFKIPKFNPDGTFTSNGSRNIIRAARRDVPIRKLSPSKVALTSYYSKTFITRSEKKVHDFAGWMTNQIAARGLDTADTSVTDVVLANVFNSYDVVPRVYSIMAQRFRSFKADGREFFFDYANRKEYFGEAWVNEAERDGFTVIGRYRKKPIVVDRLDALYYLNGDQVEELGRFEKLLDLKGRQPLETVEIRLMNKIVPLGVIMAYLLGIERLAALVNANPRRVPSGERVSLDEDEFAVRFEDETWAISRSNKIAAMLFSGFVTIEKSVQNYAVHLFDRKDIYMNVLEQNRIGARYLREADLMMEMFVDPITKTILEQMNEPTDLIGLFVRACELMMTDWSPSETDMRYMRVAGYERVAGMVYSELVRSIRGHRSRGSVSRTKMEMAPFAVWQGITQDSAVKLVEVSNPLHNLKEREEITFSGTGGRSGRSMVQSTRVFHDSDLGMISEATKDSGDVAITTYMTMDPNITDLYGQTRPYDAKVDGPAKLVSTTMMFSPAGDRDD